MNKIKPLIAVLILLFAGTIHAQNNTFEITYNIKGIQTNSASVSIFGNADAVEYETTEITIRDRPYQGITIDNGKFVFRGTTSEPVLVRLWPNNDPQLSKGNLPGVKSEVIWVIVYPGARINVSGDITGKDYMSVNARDGGENDHFADLAQKMMPLYNQIANIRLIRDSNASEEERVRNQEKSRALNQELLNVKTDFLESRPNSMAALWLMQDMLIRTQIEPERLKPLLAKVDKKKYGDNFFYKAVSDRVNGAYLTAVGQMSPNIEVDGSLTYDSKPFSLSNLKGKYVIIDFWGTWCGPCRADMPNLIAFRSKHHDKLEVLAIAQDRTQEIWKNGVVELKMTDLINVFSSKDDKDFVSKFNVQGFPTKILLSPEGKILYRSSGGGDFYTKVEEFMAK